MGRKPRLPARPAGWPGAAVQTGTWPPAHPSVGGAFGLQKQVPRWRGVFLRLPTYCEGACSGPAC